VDWWVVKAQQAKNPSIQQSSNRDEPAKQADGFAFRADGAFSLGAVLADSV
jgi:hypothetical protein